MFQSKVACCVDVYLEASFRCPPPSGAHPRFPGNPKQYLSACFSLSLAIPQDKVTHRQYPRTQAPRTTPVPCLGSVGHTTFTSPYYNCLLAPLLLRACFLTGPGIVSICQMEHAGFRILMTLSVSVNIFYLVAVRVIEQWQTFRTQTGLSAEEVWALPNFC